MSLRDEVNSVVQSAVIEYLSEFKESGLTSDVVDVDRNTRLFGSKGLLDSMGVVILLTDLEERLEDLLGSPVTLASDSAMSSARSPFRTVATLCDYIFNILESEER